MTRQQLSNFEKSFWGNFNSLLPHQFKYAYMTHDALRNPNMIFMGHTMRNSNCPWDDFRKKMIRSCLLYIPKKSCSAWYNVIIMSLQISIGDAQCYWNCRLYRMILRKILKYMFTPSATLSSIHWGLRSKGQACCPFRWSNKLVWNIDGVWRFELPNPAFHIYSWIGSDIAYIIGLLYLLTEKS